MTATREIMNARPAERDRRRDRYVKADETGQVRPVLQVEPGMESLLDMAKFPQVSALRVDSLLDMAKGHVPSC